MRELQGGANQKSRTGPVTSTVTGCGFEELKATLHPHARSNPRFHCPAVDFTYFSY